MVGAGDQELGEPRDGPADWGGTAVLKELKKKGDKQPWLPGARVDGVVAQPDEPAGAGKTYGISPSIC